MYCKFCGKKINDGERFCSECGKKIIDFEDGIEFDYNGKVSTAEFIKNFAISFIGLVITIVIVIWVKENFFDAKNTVSNNENVYGYNEEQNVNDYNNQNTGVILNGEDIYNYITQNAIETGEVEEGASFPNYDDTGFPDQVELEKCNVKIKKGVYANYMYDLYQGMNYYRSDGSRSVMYVTLYFYCGGENSKVLKANYTVMP